MLGEWYLPPGECQVIWTITEGTVSISHHAIHPLPTRIPQTPFPQADKSNNPRPTTVPRSGGLSLLSHGPKPFRCSGYQAPGRAAPVEYVNVFRILVLEQLGLDANERIFLEKVELPDIS